MTFALFDPDGRCWHDQLPAFALTSRFFTRRHVTNYLTTNMGWVEIETVTNGLAVKLRPKFVALRALGAAYFFLAARRTPRLAAVLFSGRRWTQTLLVDDPDTDTTALSQLIVLAEGPASPGTDILHRRRSARHLPPQCPLAGALALWKQSASRAELEDYARRCLSSRFLWIEGPSQGEVLHLTGTGNGYSDKMQTVLKAAIGLPIEHIGNLAYGKYCNEVYTAVARSGRPMLGEVDALVLVPGEPTLSRTYRRLIVPLRKSTGGVSLFCVSVDDPTIDLRHQAA